jgi:uncharacterized Zn finger protein
MLRCQGCGGQLQFERMTTQEVVYRCESCGAVNKQKIRVVSR